MELSRGHPRFASANVGQGLHSAAPHTGDSKPGAHAPSSSS